MNFFLTALLLGFVSMIIVFISGLTSGVVGFATLAIRAVFACAMTSAATYFIMMLFDYYEEMQAKKLKQDVEEIIQETPAENAENIESPPQQETETFQPMSAENLPNVGK